jgi:hypothetical protein
VLEGVQFLGNSLLQHMLPGGFKRRCHTGLLARRDKTQRPKQAHQLLQMSAANPYAAEDAVAFMSKVAAIVPKHYRPPAIRCRGSA